MPIENALHQHYSIWLQTILPFSFPGILVAPNVWLAFLVKRPPGEQRYKSTLIIYGCLVFASVIFIYVRAAVFLLVSLKCTERLHDNMVIAVLRAPVLFFDSNPLGRILNRFSEDIGCMDEILPQKFLLSIQLSLLLLTTFTLPIVANPWLLIVFLPVAVLVGFITRYYLKTSRDLKRLEVASRSPVLSHLAETMNGLDTIRTRSRQRAFEDKFHRYMFDIFGTCCRYISDIHVSLVEQWNGGTMRLSLRIGATCSEVFFSKT